MGSLALHLDSAHGWSQHRRREGQLISLTGSSLSYISLHQLPNIVGPILNARGASDTATMAPRKAAASASSPWGRPSSSCLFPLSPCYLRSTALADAGLQSTIVSVNSCLLALALLLYGITACRLLLVSFVKTSLDAFSHGLRLSARSPPNETVDGRRRARARAQDP